MEKGATVVKQTIARVHGVVYNRLNQNSTEFLQRNSKNIPLWLTADAVTSGRLALVFPTAILISRDYTIIPATLVLVNAAFDYVDGAVARWEKNDQARALAQRMRSVNYTDVGVIHNNKASSISNAWGAYYDALADKAFAIPVWCSICAVNPEALWLQVAVLSHVAVEGVSAYTRTKSYYSRPEASSIVIANATGKVKQMISMLGTALTLIPVTQVAGGILLWASLPLSIASLADKLQTTELPRVLVCSKDLFHPRVLSALTIARQNAEVIACVRDDASNKDAALNVSESIDGTFFFKVSS